MKKLILSLFVLVMVAINAMAQDRTITGTVTSSEDGSPIPGVSVRVKEVPNIGAITGSDGKYTVRVPASGKTLHFKSIGFNDVEMPISSTTINVKLASNVQSLDGIVITAGGLATTRAALSTASTTLKAVDLVQAKPTNIATALAGKVPGLTLNLTSGGLNPSVRLVLRGNRSLLGDNTALVVLDNVIVPNTILGNLNPDDIEDIQVLNGGGAAALYGSDASNGALIITTKRGKAGRPQISFAQTANFETVNFYPAMQTRFGAGTEPDFPTYDNHENQQYGPAYDGSLRPIGDPLEDGTIQKVIYSPNNSKKEFWETGKTYISDFSVSGGSDDQRSTYYMSSQYVDISGTTLKDKYNRFSLRLNGTNAFSSKFDANYNVNFVQNRTDATGATGSIYDQMNETPSNIPLTSYKDWRNDKFANPNGYYNAYYANPYFTIDNDRSVTKNQYITGGVDFKFKAQPWLNFVYRANINTRNVAVKSWVNKFVLSDYTKSLNISTVKNSDIAGNVSDQGNFSTQVSSEFQAQITKRFAEDFKLNFVVAASLKSATTKNVSVSATGLTFRDLFNVAHRLNANTTGAETNTKVNDQAVYGDMRLSYKNYLFLHGSLRNDWTSTLPLDRNSVLYPAIDASFIASEAIQAIKETKFINQLKFFGGYSEVGNINLGAYSLLATFSQSNGYPYNSNPGYVRSNTLYNPNIKPERTRGYEVGTEFTIANNRISGKVAYYNTSTTDQIVPVSITTTTGYTQYYTNTGEVSNQGIETLLNLVAFRNDNWEWNIGGNYSYFDNKTVSISDDLERLNVGSINWAVPGKTYPVFLTNGFKRDNLGRIIVNPNTGYPSATETIVELGNSSPKHILGLNSSVTFKGVRLSAVAEYRGGFSIYNSAGATFDFAGSGERTVLHNRQRFVIPNSSYLDPATNTYVANNSITVRDGGQGFWAENSPNRSITENYITSGAYWKIREVSLSYQLPASWLSGQKAIKGINISVQGRNLFLATPRENLYTDPDYSGTGNSIGVNSFSQTPPTRFFGGTIRVTL